jgi:hypothetical protein
MYIFGKNYGSIGNGVSAFESMGHILVNVTIRWGIYTRATGLMQTKHMHFLITYLLFYVTYRVNMEQGLQHRIFVKVVNSFRS